jgi:hypothetical protein
MRDVFVAYYQLTKQGEENEALEVCEGSARSGIEIIGDHWRFFPGEGTLSSLRAWRSMQSMHSAATELHFPTYVFRCRGKGAVQSYGWSACRGGMVVHKNAQLVQWPLQRVVQWRSCDLRVCPHQRGPSIHLPASC